MTTLEDRSCRAKIIDVREQRLLARPLEYRTDTSTGQVVLEGYAATFTPYDVYGGVDAGGWVEEIDLRAFDQTLGAEPDVQLLLNHEGLPLARTKSGTLQLRTDRYGLLVRATLDPSDPDVQRLMPKMRRGDMDEMSFAFRVRDQRWDPNYTHRTITNVNLEKGDVSMVNYGMNPATAAILSSASAIDTLAKLSASELLELRNLDKDRVRKALAVLERASTPKAYKDVSNFADPGYKDSAGNPAKGGNGVKRYPLNSAARVRSAWRYISMPKNRKGYTSEQLSAIEGKIKSAAKKFGVDIADAKSLRVARIEARSHQGGTVLVAVMADGSRVPVVSGSETRAWTPGQGPGPLDDPHAVAFSTGRGISADPDSGPEGQDMSMDTQFNAMSMDDEECDGLDDGGGEDRADDEPDDEPDDDQDERDLGADATARTLDLAKVVSLEHTIMTCYDMASGDTDMQAMLARARRQVRDLQGVPAQQVDVTRKLEELRTEFGDPATISVAEGLRAISQMGFTDTVRPRTA